MSTPPSSFKVPSIIPRSRASVAGLQDTSMTLSASLALTASHTERSIPFLGGSHTITFFLPASCEKSAGNFSSTVPQMLNILSERPLSSFSSSAQAEASGTTSIP